MPIVSKIFLKRTNLYEYQNDNKVLIWTNIYNIYTIVYNCIILKNARSFLIEKEVNIFILWDLEYCITISLTTLGLLYIFPYKKYYIKDRKYVLDNTDVVKIKENIVTYIVSCSHIIKFLPTLYNNTIMYYIYFDKKKLFSFYYYLIRYSYIVYWIPIIYIFSSICLFLILIFVVELDKLFEKIMEPTKKIHFNTIGKMNVKIEKKQPNFDDFFIDT